MKVRKRTSSGYGRRPVANCDRDSRRGGTRYGYRSIQLREAPTRHGQEGQGCTKREKRLEKTDDVDELDEEMEEDTGPRLSNEEIMERVADLHRRYDDGGMDLDTFDELKAELMAQMVID